MYDKAHFTKGEAIRNENVQLDAQLGCCQKLANAQLFDVLCEPSG